jgi:transposase-like protein
VANKDSFQQLEASLLYCPRCQQAMPVRKKLLLILPEGNKFEYLCTACSSTCGDKIEPDEPRPRLLM